MQIKINEKILSIPPYISTTWSRIVALHMQEGLLVISLNDGNTVMIPGLQPDIVEQIFNCHAVYLDSTFTYPEVSSSPSFKQDRLNELFEQAEPNFRFALGSLDSLGNVMQHNPAQANAPDLPAELLQKISAISKILIPEEATLPKAEPACNCFYCQIARAINPLSLTKEVDIHHEEHVSDMELQFQEWNITQIGDKLFSVSNQLNDKEKYNVYLGEPIGCTCGKQGCEHIIAVLKS